MNEDDRELLRHIVNMSNKELVKLIEVDYENYREEAVELAKEELKKRNLDRVYLDKDSGGNLITKKTRTESPEYTTLGKLLPKADFELIQKELLECFPEEAENMDLYADAFVALKALEPAGEADICIRFSGKRRSSKDENAIDWDVVGEDLATGQHFGIEFCRWSEWLSYKVDKWELDQIGADKFLALCLWKMTSNGFSEEEIQRMLDTVKNDAFLEQQAMAAVEGNVREADTQSEEKSELHPWLRYFARNIDSFLIAFVLAFILKTIAPNVLSFVRGTLNGVIYYCVSFIIELLIEGLLLSTWGTTVGKWLFNIRVRDAADNIVSYNTAIKRAAMVLLYGRGLCIPIVGLIAEIASYDSLMKRKITKWDVACETQVICESIGVLRGILAAVVLIASLYATVYFI